MIAEGQEMTQHIIAEGQEMTQHMIAEGQAVTHHMLAEGRERIRRRISSAASSGSAVPPPPPAKLGQSEQDNWDRHFDPTSGHYFFHNPRTGESKWDEPQQL